MSIRTYTELTNLQTFDERYAYLRLDGEVGSETFGFDRVFNQMFYHSMEWRRVRDLVIARDYGCDLGVCGHEIIGKTKIVIHHMNPIAMQDIQNRTAILLDPEFLITTILTTHNAIHYGESPQNVTTSERAPNDTCPWRQPERKTNGQHTDVY